MRKILKVVMLTLSLTSCAEVTEGLRDISQGTFVKKRVGNPFRTEQTTDSSLYNSLVNLSQGKAVGSSIKMETSDLMLFKALNYNTLIQENEVNYDYDQVELLSNELKRHKIFVKESKAGEKCSSPLSNNQRYTSSTYEFMINGKKLYILQYGSVCGSCLYKPIVITKNQPCKVLNTLSILGITRECLKICLKNIKKDTYISFLIEVSIRSFGLFLYYYFFHL